jgi:malate dehydrogenase
VAGAAAQALASRDAVRRVLIVDANQSAAAGKALDIRQSGPIEGFRASLEGTNDESRLAGCDVCVIADRFGAAGEWRGEEALSMLTRIVPHLGDAPLVFAGASQADLITNAATETSVRRGRLIGSSPEALISAIKAIVSMEAECSPRDVMLTVLGAPPSGFVVPWGEASIGGYAMPRVLSQVQLARIESRTAHLWPPGPYALGAAAALVAAAILSGSRQSFSVLTPLGGEFGVKGRVGALPARFGRLGIVATRVPELDTRQQVRLQVALGG